MTLKGWDSLYSDEDADQPGLRPMPGTDAYLAWVAEQKRRRKDAAADAARPPHLETDEALADALAGQVSAKKKGRSTVILGATVASKTGVRARDLRGKPTPRITVSPEDQEVEVTANYMRFDLDLFRLFPTLTEAELRIYLDLIRRSYGETPPRNMCVASCREIGVTAGVGSPNAQVRIVRQLEDKGLVKRLEIGRGPQRQSVFRVFLPCELPRSESKTTLNYASSAPVSKRGPRRRSSTK